MACSPNPSAAIPTPLVAPEKPVTGEWELLLAAAKKEGTVTYYFEGSPEARTKISEEIRKKYGIDVEFVVGKGDEITAKIKQERQAGLFWADLVSVGPDPAEDLRKADSLVVLDRYLISPEALDPGVWPGGRPKFLNEQHTLVGLTYYYQPFILTNSDMVKENEITSHLDLLQPRWKGKIILFDPTISGSGTWWIAYLQRAMGEEWADKFFKELIKQDLIVTRDNRLHAESVVRGKYPVGIAYSNSASGQFLKMGAPIRPTSTAEGGQVSSGAGSVSMLDKAPHPKAATLLLNWLLTKEGSTLYAEAAGYLPIRSDIDPTWVHPALIPPKGGKLLWVDQEFLAFVATNGRDLGRKYFGELVK